MDLGRETRFAFRRLARRPGLPLLAVALLAVGLGGNLALLSVVDAILFRQPPVQGPERLVRILRTDSHRSTEDNWSYPTADDLRRGATTISDAAIYADWQPFHLQVGHGDAVRLQGSVVTGNYFQMLGTRPALGRLLNPADDVAGSPSPVVVIAHDLWRTRFGADPKVVGKTVSLDGKTFTVVGVAPRGFHSLDPTLGPQVWVPISAWTALLSDESRSNLLTQRGSSWLDVLARLTPGATVQAAQAEMEARIAALADQFPDSLRAQAGEVIDSAHAWVMPVSTARVGGPEAAPQVDRQAAIVAAVGALVLLVVALNLAALLAARATQARHETAVRAALGASRAQLARPLVLDGMLLALAGGGLALPFASATAGLARRALGYVLPLANDPGALAGSPRVLLAGAALVALTALAVGALPGLAASGVPLVPALRRQEVTRPGSRFAAPDLLVSAQVALSIVLVLLASLLVSRFHRLTSIDPRFDPAGVVQASYDVGLQGYTPARRAHFHEEVLRRAQATLGARQVALTDWTPLAGSWSRTSITVADYQGAPGEAPNADVSWVSPNLFRVLGIHLERGRLITSEDRSDSSAVAVINATMARRFFGRRDPVGAVFYRGRGTNSANAITIVGVVDDARYRDLTSEVPAMFFRPLAQRAAPPTRLTIVARSDRPAAASATLRGIFRELDPELPLYRTGRLSDQVARSLDDLRRAAKLFSGFAILVLVIAAAGLGALTLVSVARRRREIGVRLALGAQRRSVLTMLIRRTALLVGSGIAAGLLFAGFAIPAIGQLADARAELRPWAVLCACLLLSGAAAAALWFPLRRALAIDPAETLRSE